MYNEEHFFGKKNKYDTSTSIKKHKHNNIRGGALHESGNLQGALDESGDLQLARNMALHEVHAERHPQRVAQRPELLPEPLLEHMAEHTEAFKEEKKKKIQLIIDGLKLINHDNECDLVGKNKTKITGTIQNLIKDLYDNLISSNTIIIPDDQTFTSANNKCKCKFTTIIDEYFDDR